MLRPRAPHASSRRGLGSSGLLPTLAVVALGAVVLALSASAAVAASGAGVKAKTPVAAKRTPVASGVYHALALTSSGAVYDWGWNIVGQLGNGSTNASDVPVKVHLPGGTKATGIAGGFAHSLAVMSSGAVYAWGKGYNGDLGNGTNSDSDVPVRVSLPAGTKATAVAAGGDDSLALTSTHAVLAWGYNGYGQLGNGSTGNTNTPVSVMLPTGTVVTAVAAGSIDSLALTSTGSVLAWGYNLDGELGDGTKTNSDAPVTVKLPPGTKVTAIAAGGYSSLALTSTGAVYAWGYNAEGELGNGTKTNSDVPVKVKLSAKVTAIAAGGGIEGVGTTGPGPGHSLAATSTGKVYAWGYNADGEFGNGGMNGQHRAREGEAARGQEGDRRRRRPATEPGDDLDGRTVRLGRKRLRPARRRELRLERSAGAGEAAVRLHHDAGPLTRHGDRSPRALGFAAGLTATLALAQPVLASTERATTARAANVPSTVLAGLDFNNYIGVPGSVSAAIVVPKLNCKGTPTAGSSIDAGVGIQSVNSYARLTLACTPQGAARYYPSLVVNGTVENVMSDSARAGDMVRVRGHPERREGDGHRHRRDAQVQRHPQRQRQRHGPGHPGGRLCRGFRVDDRGSAKLRHRDILQRGGQRISIRHHAHWTHGR